MIIAQMVSESEKTYALISGGHYQIIQDTRTPEGAWWRAMKMKN